MKMNKFLMATAVAAIFTGSVVAYTTARAASDDLDTDAVIVVAMTVTCGTALNFGDIGATVAGGTVVMDLANGATHTGVSDLGGTQTTGSCAVTGDAARPYSYTLTPTVLDDGGLGDDMTLTDIETESVNTGPASGVGPHSAVLAASADTLLIGATLNVGANQLAGAYSGTIDVTVDYE